MANSPTASPPAPPTAPPPPAQSPVIRAIAMPADTNPSGDIFGGWLLAQMDLAAASVAARRAAGRTATVAVDAMTFLAPVAVGDEVSIYARVVSTGRTSIRVAVEAFRRHRHEDEVVKVTEGVITCVAIDKDRNPRALPPS